MNKIRTVLILLATLQIATAKDYVEVTANKVNLRIAEGSTGEIIGQVNKGDKLEVLGDPKAPWVKVAAPESINLWIHSNYQKDGEVIANSVRIRTGASLNHKDIGRLNKGDKITIRGHIGEWTKIAAPASIPLWITNAYVKACKPTPPPKVVVTTTPKAPIEIPKEKPKQEEKPKPKVVEKPVITNVEVQPLVVQDDTKSNPKANTHQAYDSRTPYSVETQKRRTLFGDVDANKKIGPARIVASSLRDDIPQLSNASYTGILEKAIASYPTSYILTSTTPGSKVKKTVCYIIGNTSQLDSLVGSKYQFSGKVYWFKRTTVPTLYTEGIKKIK